MTQTTFSCYLVTKQGDGRTSAEVSRRSIEDLPPGEVLIRVSYSSLNYKDALSATGNAGVTRKFPHVPGIDAAGIVAASQSSKFREGDSVLVTGFDLGQNTWGGFGEYVRVREGWVVPLPQGLSLRESMIFGTAGFTAALGVEALAAHGIGPDVGSVAVTGATGGVGSVAVAILARLGYRVIAASGKESARAFLEKLGATEIVSRADVTDTSGKPLLAAKWAGAVDTVGGNVLSTVIRSTQRAGCVTACGLVGGSDLPITVFPFILRGVQLVGIDSAEYPIGRRAAVWSKLAGPWRPADLEGLVTEWVDLAGLAPQIERILAGGICGRVLVAHHG